MAKKVAHLQLSFRDHGMMTLPPLMRRFVRRRENFLAHPHLEEELHRLRIAGKSLRYAMEVYEVCYGQVFHRCLADLEEVVEQLGAVHDHDVFLDRFEVYRKTGPRHGKVPEKISQGLLREMQKKRERMFRSLLKKLKFTGGKRFYRRLRKSMNETR